MEILTRMFDTSDFPARWYCGNWSSGHGWLHITADVTVWLCYMTIPLMIIYFYQKRKEQIPYPRVAWLFAAFIFSCGTVHLMEAVIFWWPAYRFSGTLKAVTAVVSVGTVFALVPVIPKALALPGIVSLNEQLMAEIQERTVAEEKLEAQAQELTAINKELDDFVYIASHDLQEPLRTLSSYCDLLKEDLPDELSEDAQEDLMFINDAARRMKSLLESLLRFSRLGRSMMQEADFPLAQCLDEVLQTLQVRIEESSAEIKKPDDLPILYGDKTLLGTVFQNLLQNAIKFQEDQPVVEITVQQTDEEIILGVKDNGIGLEPQYAEKIFQPFQRLHGMTKYEGSGIGLAICRKIVDKHKGRIWVESTPGEGSHFQFSLGLDRVRPAETEERDTDSA